MYQQCLTFLLDDKVPTVLVGGEEPQMVLAVSILTALTERDFTSHLPRTICLSLVTSPISLNPELSVKLVKSRGGMVSRMRVASGTNNTDIRAEVQTKNCQKFRQKAIKHI